MKTIEIQNDKDSFLRVEEREYRGKRYVDMRIWMIGVPDPMPTKKGFILSVEQFEEFCSALDKEKGV